jgi:glutathione S-transferase
MYKLIIGNKNYSSWSLRPWLLMKYHSIPFDEIKIPLYAETSKQQLLQYSAAGKVPVL